MTPTFVRVFGTLSDVPKKPQRKSQGLPENERVWLRKIADNIRRVRKDKGHSQERFAGFIHSTGSTVAYWERAILIPDVVDMYRMSDAFNIPLRDLFEGMSYAQKPRQERLDEIMQRLDVMGEQLSRVVAATRADEPNSQDRGPAKPIGVSRRG